MSKSSDLHNTVLLILAVGGFKFAGNYRDAPRPGPVDAV